VPESSTPLEDRAIAVLDDDPTGPQASVGVPVLLRWEVTTLRRAAAAGAGAFHVLTNTRSLDPAEAERVTRSAATAVADALGPGTPIVMRGDSTLRAHLREEYLAVRDVTCPGAWPALLLVPALPSAGRVTVDGVHLLEDALGARRPLHETEYAADPAFGYPDARLLRWAEHRSGGLFAAERGVQLPLRDLRGPAGAERVAATLITASRRAAAEGPLVVVPDAETVEDVATIAAGWRAARRQAPLLVRSGPAFVTVAAGTAARGLVDVGPFERALVVCGSHVGLSTMQLRALERRFPETGVEVGVTDLAADEPATRAAEVERAAALVDERLRSGGLAVLSTPRVRPPELSSLATGRRVADGICAIVRSLGTPPDGVVVKGGITSATVARDGFGAAAGTVIGPVETGVALWSLETERGPLPYVVVPGNVGDEGTLARLAERVAAAAAPAGERS
jgi:uncharacterized protein YgbK (DUF1537 family)